MVDLTIDQKDYKTYEQRSRYDVSRRRRYKSKAIEKEAKEDEKAEEEEEETRFVLDHLSLPYTRSYDADFFTCADFIAIKDILKNQFTYSNLISKKHHHSGSISDIDPEKIPEFISHMRYHEGFAVNHIMGVTYPSALSSSLAQKCLPLFQVCFKFSYILTLYSTCGIYL
jgi:hypothetical protein